MVKINECFIFIDKKIIDRLCEYIMDRRVKIFVVRKYLYVFVIYKYGKYYGKLILNSIFVNRVLKFVVVIYLELFEEIICYGFCYNFNYKFFKKIDVINKVVKENFKIKFINEKKEI